MVEWELATKIGVVGFLTVLVVLSIVALSIWIVGMLLQRGGAESGEKNQEKKN